MEVVSSFSTNLSSQSFFVAVLVTAICCLFAVLAIRSSPKSVNSEGESSSKKGCNCSCSCKVNGRNSSLMATATETVVEPYLNGGSGVGNGEMVERRPLAAAAERQSGASMMEQLVPEITTHALSYLDFPSLCRLSMTNSLMRKAANDDNAWKALYHKDFTLEQDTVTPANGWKAYYAATRAIVNRNAEFFNIIRERSLPAMGRFWLNADYVKCVHASGVLFSGYTSVMGSWHLAFSWEQAVNFQVRDVKARVLTDVAWVTMKAFVDMEAGPFDVTNIYELHNGRWYMVHHHSSVVLIHHGPDQQMILV